MCRSHRNLQNNLKSERAYNLKIFYNEIPRNQVVLSNAIQQQEIDEDREFGRKYVAGPISMASINHV